MTDDQLQAMARECGAEVTDYFNYASDRNMVVFVTTDALQAFALRVEAKAVAEAMKPYADYCRSCTLTFFDGKLVKVEAGVSRPNITPTPAPMGQPGEG